MIGDNWFMEIAEGRRRAPCQACSQPPVLLHHGNGVGGGEGRGAGQGKWGFRDKRFTCWAPAPHLSHFHCVCVLGRGCCHSNLGCLHQCSLTLCSGLYRAHCWGNGEGDMGSVHGSPSLGDRGAAHNFIYIKYVRPVLPLLSVCKGGRAQLGQAPGGGGSQARL